MRIIAGEWKGLQLQGPKGMSVRPTTDRVKESMFNLMGPLDAGLPVVDLFAGSGSLGIEALSRGAEHAFFVDKSGQSLKTLKINLERCRAGSRASVLKMDWKSALMQLRRERTRIGWILLDPPYHLNLWEEVLEFVNKLGFEVVNGIVCEHSQSFALPSTVTGFEKFKERAYGDIWLSLYRAELVLKEDAE